jgi:cytoskeleton protein RodZ
VPDVRTTAPPAPQVVAEPAVQPAATTSELTTTQPVWVRVIADGQRVVERELPANARVPLTAERTIVIRAGNAGAVRVTLAGQDLGILGAEGTVITRTFTVPRPAR